jgi:hypothetical protein
MDRRGFGLLLMISGRLAALAVWVVKALHWG